MTAESINGRRITKLQANDDRYYLWFSTFTYNRECPYAKWITFKMSCPFIFGDDQVHEIVTFWREIETFRHIYSYQCNRVEVDSVEYISDYIFHKGYYGITLTRPE